MYSVNENFKKVFAPLVILLSIQAVLFSDLYFFNLVARFDAYDLLRVDNLFAVLFFVVTFIYVIIPFSKILHNKYGTLTQRILLTLSIVLMVFIYLFFAGFDSWLVLYTLYLAIFLNFTSKLVESNHSSIIVSTSQINILLIPCLSIILLVLHNHISLYMGSALFTFAFIISSIVYLERMR